MSQLAFVACIRGWQWRRQRQRAAATSSSNDGNNNAQKGKTKRRKQVSHSGLNVRAPFPPPPDLSPPFHCQILLQQAIAAIGLARSGQATNVGSRRGVGRGGVALFNSNCNCNSTCYSFLLQMEMETPFQQFSDK